MTSPKLEREAALPLQNRIDPFGRPHAVGARGLFTGNRGVIHNAETKTLLSRRWTTKAWIVCSLDHPAGRRREPMGRNTPSGGAGWTELFFLDEVTALAAGHRPCFFCRRAAAEEFRHRFVLGNGLDESSAPAMDAILHRQRLASGGSLTVLSSDAIAALPEGTMIGVGEQALALHGGSAFPWSFAGYGKAQAVPKTAALLTPTSTVAALKAGFSPAWHPSAQLAAKA